MPKKTIQITERPELAIPVGNPCVEFSKVTPEQTFSYRMLMAYKCLKSAPRKERSLNTNASQEIIEEGASEKLSIVEQSAGIQV